MKNAGARFETLVIAIAITVVLWPLAGRADTPAAATVDPPVMENDGAPIRLGAPVSHANLTLYPLVSAAAGRPTSYTPLDKAMDAGKVEVRELPSASVPTLHVDNGGDEKIFVKTGEIVTGAKQDRMSAADVILAPGATDVRLSVYCVERGRWQQRSGRFSAGKTAGTPLLRKSAAKGGNNQGIIWAKVAKKSRDAAVVSNTGTLQAVYRSGPMRQRIIAHENAFAPLGRRDETVGFVAAVNGDIVSVDVFESHALFEALYGKLLKAVALEAVTAGTPSKEAPSPEVVRGFVATGLREDARIVVDNPGLGTSYRIEGIGDISGNMLIHEGRIVHLSLFGPDREAAPRAFPSLEYRRPSDGNVHRNRRPASKSAQRRSSF